MLGRDTLAVEVPHVSRHGFWLLIGDEELLVPFTHFPWFQQATIERLLNVERPTTDHLYWPQLGIDLSVQSYTILRHFRSSPGSGGSPKAADDQTGFHHTTQTRPSIED